MFFYFVWGFMLKQVLNIVFAGFIVLTISTGITVHYHYCNNTLQSVGLFSAPNPCCSMGEECCHDESQFFKVDTDFLAANFASDTQESFHDIGFEKNHLVGLQKVHPSCQLSKYSYHHHPPPKISYQVLFQSFLF